MVSMLRFIQTTKPMLEFKWNGPDLEKQNVSSEFLFHSAI